MPIQSSPFDFKSNYRHGEEGFQHAKWKSIDENIASNLLPDIAEEYDIQNFAVNVIHTTEKNMIIQVFTDNEAPFELIKSRLKAEYGASLIEHHPRDKF